MGIIRELEKFTTVEVMRADERVTGARYLRPKRARKMRVRDLVSNLPKCQLIAILHYLQARKPRPTNDDDDLKALIASTRRRVSNIAVGELLEAVQHLGEFGGPNTRVSRLRRFINRILSLFRRK